MNTPYGQDPAAPPVTDAEFRPYFKLQVGGVLSESFGAYFSNFFAFTFICLLALSPVIVWGVIVLSDLSVSSFGLGGDDSLIYFLIGMGGAAFLLQPIATGAIIYGVFRRQRGQGASLGKCLSVGFSRLFPLLGVTLLTVLGMAAILIPAVLIAATVPILGILLALAAVVPLMMFYCAAYAAAPAVVVEKIGVIEAFSRSFRLTRGNRGRIFGVILVIGILQKVIDWVLEKGLVDPSSITGFGDLPSFLTNFKIYIGISLGISVFFAGITASAAALVYYQLKVQSEGMDETELASIFD